MLRPLLAFLMAFRIGLTTPQKQPKDCQFPSTWEGTWYHSGFPHPLNISAKHISSKGTCVQQSGSMFIMVDRYVIFLIRWTFISSITSSCRLYISNAQRVFLSARSMRALIHLGIFFILTPIFPLQVILTPIFPLFLNLVILTPIFPSFCSVIALTSVSIVTSVLQAL